MTYIRPNIYTVEPPFKHIYSRTSLIQDSQVTGTSLYRQLLCTLRLGKASQLANLTAAFGWAVQRAALF